MNEPQRSRRWLVVVLILFALCLGNIFMATYVVTIGSKLNDTQSELEVARARIDAADNLRTSQAKAAKARVQSECRSRIRGVKLANGLFASLRDLATIPQQNILDALRDPSLSPKMAADLESAIARYKRAKDRFHGYPLPKCDQGKQKKKQP